MVNLKQLRDAERARPWLYRILRNEYLHRIRDERRSLIVPMENLGELPERETEAAAEIDSATLQAALNDLDETFRTPLILYYFEEMSYKDIAEQLDTPIGTVMSRLARGKQYLKQRLSPATQEQWATE
jgi:RNA polymerase sigma-70 factor (ECF subfamily)